jgi:hypothetical protein
MPMTIATKTTKSTARRRKRDTGSAAERARKKTGLSGLDAAAQVLARADGPMRCGDLAAAIIAQGLWTTKGKTPAATLNAAIIREIKAKGAQSRFRKTSRGLFTARTSKD